MFYSSEDTEHSRLNAWKHFGMKTLFRTLEERNKFLVADWKTGHLSPWILCCHTTCYCAGRIKVVEELYWVEGRLTHQLQHFYLF